MANSYGELIGNAAETAMAFAQMWNTPATSVPSPSTTAVVKGCQRLLMKLSAPSVRETGVVDDATNSAMTKRFGSQWKNDYRWQELLQDLYNDINAGRSPFASAGGLDILLEPKVKGVPVIPVVAGLGVLWFLFGGKKRR